ncbi:MAG: cytochrome c [Chloroflexi bacterium]|nr:cytochrome c [Chloroflexota bacterium]
MKNRKRNTVALRRANTYLGWGVGLLVVILVAAAAIALRSPGTSSSTIASADMLTEGKTLYDTYCAACHGFNLEGEANWKENNPDGSFRAPPHDETGHTWHHSDAYLIESIQLGGTRLEANIGVSAMPPYKDVLTDTQIDAILAYIKQDWPDDILASQQSIPNR